MSRSGPARVTKLDERTLQAVHGKDVYRMVRVGRVWELSQLVVSKSGLAQRETWAYLTNARSEAEIRQILDDVLAGRVQIDPESRVPMPRALLDRAEPARSAPPPPSPKVGATKLSKLKALRRHR